MHIAINKQIDYKLALMSSVPSSSVYIEFKNYYINITETVLV